MAGRGPHLPVIPGLAQRLRRRQLAAPPACCPSPASPVGGAPPPAPPPAGPAPQAPPRPTAPPPPHPHPAGRRHRGRRRCPRRCRAHPAAVPGQHLLVPARRRLRDRQRTGVPARHPRHQHRQQRAQRMPDPRGLRGSVSRSCSTARSDASHAGDTCAPAAPRWQRTTSISDDAYTARPFGDHPDIDTQTISRGRAPLSSTSGRARPRVAGAHRPPRPVSSPTVTGDSRA